MKIEISDETLDAIIATEMRDILDHSLDALSEEPEYAQSIQEAAAVILSYYGVGPVRGRQDGGV